MYYGEASPIKTEWVLAERKCMRLCILLGEVA